MLQSNQDYKIIIQPSKGWRMLDLLELWAYRDLLWILAVRDIKVRYKQTFLGCIWAIIQPFMSMVVFSIIFGHWAKLPADGYPYPIFVYAALLPWTFFANAVSAAGNSVVSSERLITKVYFPRLVIPLASIGAGIVDFTISFSVMLALMMYFGIGWPVSLVALPFLFLAVIFTALGIGTFISALNVSYRDFRYVIPFMMQIWMYATPVVYSPSLVPENWRWALYLNPLAGLIDGFRSAFLGKPFDMMALSISFSVALGLFLIGIHYFEQVERRFADVI
jgi:lipopolysaccharide transport system permease protein